MANIHDGHRKRILSKVETAPKTLEDHEMLETLLFYSIPRRNTNETAHLLIKTFGSVKGVLDASVKDLSMVEGVGLKSALLIKIVAELTCRYTLSSVEYKKTPLESKVALRKYITALFIGTDVEMTYLLLFDRSKRLLSTNILSTGTAVGTMVPIQKIAELVIDKRIAYAVLTHNHPDGNLYPSSEDIRVTNILVQFLRPLNIQLIDHFIVVGDSCRPIINEKTAYAYLASYIPPEENT